MSNRDYECDLNDISSQLQYITGLLEKIATAIESGVRKPTPFPWGDTRIDSRVRSLGHWDGGVRPSTFEELISIGRSSLSSGLAKTRQIGAVSIASLDPVFEEHGFGKQWRDS